MGPLRSLVALLAALHTCDALRLAAVVRAPVRPRAPSPCMQDEPAPTPDEAAEPPPAAPTAAEAAAAEAYETRSKFMGVFDTTTGGGALAASIIVSVAFCVGVEFVKVRPSPIAREPAAVRRTAALTVARLLAALQFLDPNNAGDASIFGSLSTMGQ